VPLSYSGPVGDRQRLTRSNEKMIAGVCAGLAEYLGWSVTRFRVAFVLVSIVSAAFPGIFVYLVLWALMPRREAIE
jgi:phage shock protein C